MHAQKANTPAASTLLELIFIVVAVSILVYNNIYGESVTKITNIIHNSQSKIQNYSTFEGGWVR
jgi:hypothetical protein